uniref:Uncharacterized protein n=1 Tax=Rousettus aegyptiacus TaxID=9407 RepID=A0A7J8BRN7_ROUAE|nr:hypothetical protein HJG63_009516 [Rousettus aegyptiacus]
MDHSGAVRREPGPRCHLTGLPLHQMHRHRSRRQRHCCQTHSQQAAPHPAERGSRPRSSNLPCSLCSQPTSSQRSHTRAHAPSLRLSPNASAKLMPPRRTPKAPFSQKSFSRCFNHPLFTDIFFLLSILCSRTSQS